MSNGYVVQTFFFRESVKSAFCFKGKYIFENITHRYSSVEESYQSKSKCSLNHTIVLRGVSVPLFLSTVKSNVYDRIKFLYKGLT